MMTSDNNLCPLLNSFINAPRKHKITKLMDDEETKTELSFSLVIRTILQ